MAGQFKRLEGFIRFRADVDAGRTGCIVPSNSVRVGSGHEERNVFRVLAEETHFSCALLSFPPRIHQSIVIM